MAGIFSERALYDSGERLPRRAAAAIGARQ
jgi:hypothetical protein